MALFQKRSRLRRISADRSRPVKPKALAPALPREKRAVRRVMTALFLCGMGLILTFPFPEPRLRSGDIASRTFRARLDFRVRDEEATRRARELVDAVTLRVYDEDAQALLKMPSDLEEFLRRVTQAGSDDELEDIGRSWGRSPSEMQVLKSNLSPAWLPVALPPIREGAGELARLGIMRIQDRLGEIRASRSEIAVIGEKATERARHPVGVTLAHPGDVRAFFTKRLQNILFSKPKAFNDLFVDLVTTRAAPTLALNRRATEDALQAAHAEVGDVYQTVARDSIILEKGERAGPGAVRLIREERSAYAAQAAGQNPDWRRDELRAQVASTVGMLIFFFALFLLLAVHAVQFSPGVLASNTRIFGVYAVSLILVAAARMLQQVGQELHWTPIVLGTMVLAVASGPMLTFGGIAASVLLAGIVSGAGLALIAPMLAAACVANLSLTRLRHRTDLFEAGLFAGIAHFAAVWVVHFVEQQPGGASAAWPPSLAGLIGGVLAGSVMTGALPYAEQFFDVATELRLLDWTDQNQPLLRKLALEAPGTYHHSAVVSNMAEAAAEEIGANALLARAGGYLHDVGKLSRPDYFVENRGGKTSMHDGLSPMLSALIITAHTKDGVELALQYGVPSPLRRIIAEHHGTTIAEFFYNKALQETTASDDVVKDATFRYRGPKPRSPEAAIMLADSAESAALGNASPSRLERLVHEIVQKRLDGGQLDESRTNITDIRQVEKSLVRSLLAMSHPRISYAAT